MADFIANIVIGEKLGNGHFGEVFKAKDDAHGDVALKILSRSAADEQWQERFGRDLTDAEWSARRGEHLKEAENLAKAAHPNVVKVHSVVQDSDGSAVNIVMEYCPGGSLEKLYAIGGLQLSVVRDYGTNVLLGLEALHQRGMLHRDLKPANILLDEQGTAKIADFGLVTDRLIAGYGSRKGYADHVAIEVWNGKPTSRRTDVWAFAMTIYRLLHGEKWYQSRKPDHTKVKDGGYAQSLEWLPHISKSWRSAIRKMMNDEPAKRPSSATKCMDILATLPVQANWSISEGPGQIRWQRTVGQRIQEVIWTQHSTRRHEWLAKSKPLGSAGRTVTLGRSDGTVGRSQAIAELERFFCAK